ncbi:PepSY-associated TM helix domain-containing protein [Azospirillum isscasi]|uniref:PepSY-associated TM helix domain-containing protein n=1 Tax=Azospirillum isscasi TaxID=3053926 RepID=A0ABU0WF69_9PROT|nr:PepSY-associated TM helix domain-containing protein [Azospirillum isscasi]MDQ2102843.1 PepSY-associated TM helix domain-containing protein [Azospirillum isscasi]
MSVGKSRTRLWFLWHSWLAMPIWAFLFFVCLTGTIAVVSTEIMWLVNPAMRASGAGEPLPPSALIAAAEAAAPGGRVSSLSWGGSHMAVGARMAMPDGTSTTAWVNPVSGTVQGMSTGNSFRNFFRALHGWLMTFPVGWYAVTLLAIPLVGSLITGLVVYKRFWKSFYQPRIRWSQAPRVMWGDLHRVAGTWSIWFIAVIAVTSLWFLIYMMLFHLGMGLGGGKLPVLIARDQIPVAATAPKVDADAVVRAATAALPDMRLRYLWLPGTAYDPATVSGSSGQVPLLPDYVRVNPFTAEVIVIEGGMDAASGIELTRTIMRALHTGDFGGLPVKLIWFAFGLLMTTLVFSGMLIWMKRTARATVEAVRGVRRGGAGMAEGSSNA